MLRKLCLIAALTTACGTPEEGPSTETFGDAAANVGDAASVPPIRTDAGNVAPGVDAGVVRPPDAGGQPSPDAGRTLLDAGTQTDAGNDRVDAGVRLDAGPGAADAGGIDSGSVVSDAATPDSGGATGTKFSFFVTSYASIQKLVGKDGFGGDLRFGETGAGAGLRGADKICAAIAEMGMAGSSAKQWRAFLSTSTVAAKDRVGAGPWYDRKGRLVAQTLAALIKERPEGADPQIIDDLPNEFGVPNHDPDATGQVDNHDMLTGSNTAGTLFCPDNAARCTCNDWTSSAKDNTKPPRVGHAWPRKGSGLNWMSALNEAGCGAGVNLAEDGGPKPDDPTVGSGGGYGGFYCFALTP